MSERDDLLADILSAYAILRPPVVHISAYCSNSEVIVGTDGKSGRRYVFMSPTTAATLGVRPGDDLVFPQSQDSHA